jgi:hypothetical protein
VTEPFWQGGKLRLADHERGRDLQAPTGEGAGDHSCVAAGRRGSAGQRRVGLDASRVDLNRREQTCAGSHLGDQRVGQRCKCCSERTLHLRRARIEPFALHDVEIRERRRAGCRVAGIGVPVPPTAGIAAGLDSVAT